MIRFRTFFPVIAVIILVGFTVISFEDTFYCSDKVASTHLDECCVECVTVHNMDLPATVPLVSVPIIAAFSMPVSLPYQNPFLPQIDRPPIPSFFAV